METLTIITGYVTGAKVCSCYNLFYSWNSSVWITAIICLTILLLALIIHMCIYKCKSIRLNNQANVVNNQTQQGAAGGEKNQEEKLEEAKEKKLYRERLLNFLEKRAIDKVIKEKKTVNGVETETTTVTYKDGNQECKEYTDMLKSLIKDLNPTN